MSWLEAGAVCFGLLDWEIFPTEKIDKMRYTKYMKVRIFGDFVGGGAVMDKNKGFAKMFLWLAATAFLAGAALAVASPVAAAADDYPHYRPPQISSYPERKKENPPATQKKDNGEVQENLDWGTAVHVY